MYGTFVRTNSKIYIEWNITFGDPKTNSKKCTSLRLKSSSSIWTVECVQNILRTRSQISIFPNNLFYKMGNFLLKFPGRNSLLILDVSITKNLLADDIQSASLKKILWKYPTASLRSVSQVFVQHVSYILLVCILLRLVLHWFRYMQKF